MSHNQIIKSVLKNFLENKNPGVIALKGEWGSGKTYFWNEFLKSQSKNPNTKFVKYSYCSLFGAKTIDDVRKLVYQNGVPKEEVGKEIFFVNKQITKSSLFKFSRKSAEIMRETPFLKEWNIFDALVSGASTLGLINPNEYLICFDDFERIGDNVSANEILGLVSELKENRKCKILFIFNDTELDKESLKVYSQFREKVVDVELDYNPSPEECASIIFKEYTNSSSIDSELYKNSVKLGIKNIRILKKIKNIGDGVNESIKGYNNVSLLRGVMSSITLLTYVYYGNFHNDITSSIPSLKYVEDFSPSFLYELGNNESKESYIDSWNGYLHNYGWSHTDDFDKLLISVISRGYTHFTDNELSIIDDLHESFNVGNIKAEYSAIWEDIYHGGFKNNQDEFIEKMDKLVNEYGKYLSGEELNNIVDIFRRLEVDEGKISSIINSFITQNINKIEKLNVDEIFHFRSISTDKEIYNKFQEKYNEVLGLGKINLKWVLDDAIKKGRDYIDRNFEHVIFDSSEDDIYKLFLENEGKILHRYRRILLRYRNVTNAEEGWILTTKKTLAALSRFDNCKINHLRLLAYEIIE